MSDLSLSISKNSRLIKLKDHPMPHQMLRSLLSLGLCASLIGCSASHKAGFSQRAQTSVEEELGKDENIPPAEEGILAKKINDDKEATEELESRVLPRPLSQQAGLEKDFGGECKEGYTPIKGKVYALAKDTPTLPKFENLTAISTICTTKFDVPNRDYSKGFPGVPDLLEWFAIRYESVFSPPITGEYKFKLASDDGSKLFIDGELVVDNDGTHSLKEKKGKKMLEAGKEYSLQLQYFQGPATEVALQLFWTPPGESEEIMPPASFRK